MKNIGILGSTGSVGSQALKIIKSHPSKFNVKYIAANTNFKKLIEQTNLYNPEYICIYNKTHYEDLKNSTKVKKIFVGKEGLSELIQLHNIDIALNAIGGYQGLKSTIDISNAGVDIALANKESIVQAGHIVMKLVKEKNVNLFPVDSEHSALWQCLRGENINDIKNLILTASGGPFRTLNKESFSNITKKEALNHPNWKMGPKITIDSATMMNKGFEVIEAYWLFDIKIENIKIVIHPQSLIHSMVEFIDGSIKAQISVPDMRQPIQYAFSYPNRMKIDNMNFDFNKFNELNFEKVNKNKFKCISLAYDAIQSGGSYTTVLNIANDFAVNLFLNETISFNMIPEVIYNAMNKHKSINNPTLEEIEHITNWTIQYIKNHYSKI